MSACGCVRLVQGSYMVGSLPLPPWPTNVQESMQTLPLSPDRLERGMDKEMGVLGAKGTV